jgi:hypothetical protein
MNEEKSNSKANKRFHCDEEKVIVNEIDSCFSFCLIGFLVCKKNVNSGFLFCNGRFWGDDVDQ